MNLVDENYVEASSTAAGILCRNGWLWERRPVVETMAKRTIGAQQSQPLQNLKLEHKDRCSPAKHFAWQANISGRSLPLGGDFKIHVSEQMYPQHSKGGQFKVKASAL